MKVTENPLPVRTGKGFSFFIGHWPSIDIRVQRMGTRCMERFTHGTSTAGLSPACYCSRSFLNPWSMLQCIRVPRW